MNTRIFFSALVTSLPDDRKRIAHALKECLASNGVTVTGDVVLENDYASIQRKTSRPENETSMSFIDSVPLK